MATISVSSTSNLSSVVYSKDDTIDIADGATLNITQSNSILPMIIQANGTGKINISNTATSTMLKLSFSATSNNAGLKATQNASITARGNWITVATTTGSQQTLFNCSSVGGTSIDYPTLVEIETGASTGIYEIWPVVPETVTGGHVTPLGFNTERSRDGTVAISATGVVTGTGTAFPSTSTGLQFRCNSIARDFIIDTWTSATSMALIETDGSTYAGGAVSAGTTYFIRDGSTIDREVVGNQEVGKLLFFNPVTGAVGTGNNINGTVPHAGAKVRIPNIYITSEIPQTTLASAITVTTATNITLTAAIGPATNDVSSTTADNGGLLIVEGTKVERIYYRTRSGTTVSSTSMLRAQHRTKAQTFSAGATVYWIPASGRITNNVQFNTSSSGGIDIEIVALCPWFANRPIAANYYRMNHVGSSALVWQSCPGDFSLNFVCVLGRNFRHLTDNLTGSCVNCTSNLGTGEFNDVVGVDNHAGKVANLYNMYLANVANLTSLSRVKAICFYSDQKLTGFSNTAITLLSISCSSTIRDLTCIGASARFSLNASQVVEGIHLATFANNYSPSTASLFYNVAVLQSPDCTLRKFDIVPGGGLSVPYAIYIDPTVAGLTIHNRDMPPLDGSGRLKALVRDAGADTKVSSFTLINLAANSPGVLDTSATSNSGGRYSMLLTDSQYIPVTTSGGPYSKGLAEIDIGQGNRRFLSGTTTTSLLSGMFDVQVQMVASNTQKNDCMVIVGPFSAQSKWDMLDVTGLIGGNLDNLGRIYMKANGDTVIIKCPVSLKGIASFLSTPLTFYHQGSVYGVSGVPADVTLEVRMVNWGEVHSGPWTPYVSGSTLETLRSQLVDYDSSVGIDLQWRMIKVGDNASWYAIEFTVPIVLDVAYDPPVGFVSIGVSSIPIGATLVGYDATIKKVGSLISTETSGAVKFPYNYDGVSRPYTLVCRKAGYTWFSVTGNYDRFPISIPTQMQALPSYLSGITGVTFDHINSTISVSQDRTGQEIFSAYQDELSKVANCKIPEFSNLYNGQLSTTYTILESGGVVLDNYTDFLGTHVKITAPAIIAGTRIQLYNLTDSVEVYNGVLASNGLSIPTIWTSNKTIRFRADHETKLPIETVGILSSIGLDFLDVQEEDHIYIANAVDGSTCTEFTDDDPNIQIDINDPDGVTNIHRLYAWMQWYQTTADGIASPFFGCLYALDMANYIVYSAKANLQLDNVGVLPVRIEGGYLYRDDGGTIIASTSNSIQLEPKRPSVPDVSTLAQQVWEYSLRALTVDPGSAAHAVTQAAIAALPVPASAVDVTGARDAVIAALPPSPPTANDIWNATTRSLTVDPGASAHVATQSLITTKAGDIQSDIAGLPAPLTSIETQTVVTSALTSADLATSTEITSTQALITTKANAIQTDIAGLPAPLTSVEVQSASASAITAAGLATSAQVAAIPAAPNTTEIQAAAAAAISAANVATQTDIVTAQTSIESKQDTTQAALENAIANIPSNVRTESYSGPQTPGSLGQFVQETASRVIANL